MYYSIVSSTAAADAVLCCELQVTLFLSGLRHLYRHWVCWISLNIVGYRWMRFVKDPSDLETATLLV